MFIAKGVIAMGGWVGPKVGLVLFEFLVSLIVVWAKRRLVHDESQLEALVDGSHEIGVVGSTGFGVETEE